MVQKALKLYHDASKARKCYVVSDLRKQNSEHPWSFGMTHYHSMDLLDFICLKLYCGVFSYILFARKCLLSFAYAFETDFDDLQTDFRRSFRQLTNKQHAQHIPHHYANWYCFLSQTLSNFSISASKSGISHHKIR